MALTNSYRDGISIDRVTDVESVGFVVGESKPYRAEIIASRPLTIGEYLCMEYYGYHVLSMVSSSTIGSHVITSDIYDPKDIERIVKTIKGGERMYYYKGIVNILGYLDPESQKLKIPPIPPPPGTEVFKAARSFLSKIFSPNKDSYIRIGVLLREPTVEAKVNINKVVSRHLGILAMTGMGKSNLVALIAKRVVEKNGTIVIFDYHGEYVSMNMKSLNIIKPKLNPRTMNLDEIARLLNIPVNASRQRMALYECLESNQNNGVEFFQYIKKCLQNRIARYGSSAQKLLDSITVYERYLKKILDENVDDVLNRIVLGAINVVDLSELHINQADAVIAHWLNRLLTSRKEATISENKRGFPIPILVVIEEAHVFLPNDYETATKREAISIVREGRKFGVGLVVVSQRPRGLDSTILSQLGNLAILRIVHPEDQAYVARYCESVVHEVINELPGLNTGEAILLGEWVKTPTVAKIDYVGEKLSGFDIDAVSIWHSY
ncbi:MAG: ATP-binding protein [Ignisphaera sp.]